MTRRHAQLVLVAALVALAGCSNPQRPPARTLSSPSALSAARWCEVIESGAVRYAPMSECTDDAIELGTASPVARVAVANSGDRFVHVLDVDLLRPRLIDFRLSIPGNTGVVVPDGPTAIVALDTPSLALVGSSRVPSLSLVDLPGGQLVGNPVTLPPPPRTLRRRGTDVVFALPSLDQIVVGRAEYTCDGVAATHTSRCTMAWTWTETARVDVGGPVRDIVLDDEGGAWVTAGEHPWVERWGLLPPLVDEACAGTPCLIDRVQAGWGCSDGFDDDGDGLTDADDPQCFGPDDSEDGIDRFGRTSTCTDGIDNDGDGLVDADDDGCASADDATETPEPLGACADGIDNDLDGLVDDLDDGCIATGGEHEFVRATDEGMTALAPAPPSCANGRDDDGDGAVDWPDDADCYGPNSDDESPPAAAPADGLALTAEGDLLAIVEPTTPQVILVDTARRERISVNEGELLRTTAGIALPARAPSGAFSDTVTVFDGVLDDGTTAVVTDRVIHVPSTAGIAWTIDLDRTFVVSDADTGEELLRQTYDLFVRRDADGSLARLDPVRCDIPVYAFEVFRDGGLTCDDARLPAPQVIDADALDAEADSYTVQPGAAYVGLPQRTTLVVDDETGGLVEASIPDDYRVAGDRWRLTWEGVLPRSTRGDAFLLDTQWVGFLGADPCQLGVDVCNVGLDFSECGVAQTMCDNGESLCGAGIDLCDICPSVCNGGVDMCEIGVVPGDILVIDRIPQRDLDLATCGEWVDSDDPERATDPTLVEYLITEVHADAVRIEPFPSDQRETPLGRRLEDLPPATCFGEPFDVEIRAGSSWVLQGTRTWGHRSPFQAIAGECVPRSDADLRRSRPITDEEYVSPWGFTFHIGAGTEPTLRDFAFEFDISSRFADRAARNRQFLLGPSTSDAVVIETVRGRRIVFSDDAQSFVWVYDADSFVEVDAPLP